jgi:CubicO group peptidase (beta-lactamase class C family)
MQQWVFDPIGMATTTFSFERVQGNPSHATPHGQTAAYDYVPISPDLEKPLAPMAPAGASWSNARDTARYLMTQLPRGIAPDGRRVVSAENLTVTWQPQVCCAELSRKINNPAVLA